MIRVLSALNMACVLIICDDDRTRGHLMYMLCGKQQKWSGSGGLHQVETRKVETEFFFMWVLPSIIRVFSTPSNPPHRLHIVGSYDRTNNPIRGYSTHGSGGLPEKFHGAAYTNY
jgi:hypothetical protein